MKTTCTILIVILTIVLARWLTSFKGVAGEILMTFYLIFFIAVFSYGVYRMLEDFEK